MWVVDGGSDVTTGILEDEDTGRIRTVVVHRAAFGPQVDDRLQVVNTQGDEPRRMIIGVEDDFAAVIGHRWPAVREPSRRIRLWRLEPTDAERTLCTRQVGTVLARPYDVDERAG